MSLCSTLYYIWPSCFLMACFNKRDALCMPNDCEADIILLNAYFCCYRNSFRNCFGGLVSLRKEKYWQKIVYVKKINFKYTNLLNIPNLLTCKLLIQGVIKTVNLRESDISYIICTWSELPNHGN